MAKRVRLVCSHTKLEWILADAAISKMKKNSIATHIISELKKIENICDSMELQKSTDLSTKQKRQFYLNEDYEEIFNNISKKIGIKDPSTIVSRLIITPLLQK